SKDIQDVTFNHALVTEEEESSGVVRPFALLGSSELNRLNSAPPDPMHDLTEGVLPSALTFMLNYIVAFGLLTLEELEMRFKDFASNLYEESPTLKHQGTGGLRSRVVFHLTGKAIQVSFKSF